jgi:hypothetical protein
LNLMHYWMIDIIMKFFLVFFFMIKRFRCFSLGGSLGARKTSRLKGFWQRYSHRALLFSIFVKLTKAEVLYIYNFWILWNKEVVMVWKWVQETACQSLNFVSFLKAFLLLSNNGLLTSETRFELCLCEIWVESLPMFYLYWLSV